MHQSKHLYRVQQDCEKLFGRYLDTAIIVAPYSDKFEKATNVLFAGKHAIPMLDALVTCSEFFFTDHIPCIIRIPYLTVQRIGTATEGIPIGNICMSIGVDNKKPPSPSDVIHLVKACRERSGSGPITFPKHPTT